MKAIALGLLLLSSSIMAQDVYLDCIEESQELVTEDYSFEVCTRLPNDRLCTITRQLCTLTKADIDHNRALSYTFMCYPAAPGFQEIVEYKVSVLNFDGQSCDLKLKVTGSWDD